MDELGEQMNGTKRMDTMEITNSKRDVQAPGGKLQKLQLTLERVPSPFGEMYLVTDTEGHVRALDFENYEARLRRLLRVHYGERGHELRSGQGWRSVRERIEAFSAGDIPAIDEISVRTGGSEFQRKVWAALRRIPAGATASYGDIARAIGRPSASRAVGMANGSNPVVIIVPCHRVIGADGSLTGYGGGLERKRALLTHEAVWLLRPGRSAPGVAATSAVR
jgi:methylated-DNA-[protein]-cysteine S-methyltransferase